MERSLLPVVIFSVLFLHLDLCSGNQVRGMEIRAKARASVARDIQITDIQKLMHMRNKFRRTQVNHRVNWPDFTVSRRSTPSHKTKHHSNNNAHTHANTFVTPSKSSNSREMQTPLSPQILPSGTHKFLPSIPVVVTPNSKVRPIVSSLSPITRASSPRVEQAPYHSAAMSSTSVHDPKIDPAQNGGSQTAPKAKHSAISWPIYVAVIAGLSVILVISASLFVYLRASKVVTVKPWVTGLSGQLQKAFVSGVPALKRSELQVACEDFSNIIGSLSDYTMYKGTLSSGVEIAVISTTKSSAKDWPKQCETQFRKKIRSLSKINHKNFVNLLGYCAEDLPFTRMMVFEYAPNGSLFEHLHVKEGDHLDWPKRLRIAMGIAYCVEHMHQLSPPEILRTLNTSTICLTDDFAAKVSDLFFCNEPEETDQSGVLCTELSDLSDKEGVVHKFGMILLEIITSKLPFSEDGSLELWSSYFLRGELPLRQIIDPTLKPANAETLDALSKVIMSCTDSEPKNRPTMADVTVQLREITAMPPDAATPKPSPLWWAELEIISSECDRI